MSPLDPQTPPAGEEIHLPGPSIQPFLLAIGITIALIGVTFHLSLIAIGGALSLWMIVRWLQDTQRDIEELPLHGDH